MEGEECYQICLCNNNHFMIINIRVDLNKLEGSEDRREECYQICLCNINI